MLSEDSVSATLNEVTQLLEKGTAEDGSILSATFVDDMNQNMKKLTKSLKQLESLTEQVSEKESKISSLLHMANTRQMENLVGRLEETLQRETELRELEEEQQRKQLKLQLQKQSKRSKKSLLATNNDSSVKNNVTIEITSDTLDERLDTNAIMEESEVEMRKWILTLIEEELDIYKEEVLAKAHIDTSNNSNSDTDDTKARNCPSTTSIVQKVQQALNYYAEDGIGKVDHSQGATVVHWLTSETHSPATIPSGTLGSVWWSKFIPQDWERLLPSGWEKWEVGIPSYVYHSLVRGNIVLGNTYSFYERVLFYLRIIPSCHFIHSFIQNYFAS